MEAGRGRGERSLYIQRALGPCRDVVTQLDAARWDRPCGRCIEDRIGNRRSIPRNGDRSAEGMTIKVEAAASQNNIGVGQRRVIADGQHAVVDSDPTGVTGAR